ncbi:MAG: STAS domain-containing protein [Bacteroidota bacterium]
MEIKETTQANFVTLSPQGDLDAHSSVALDEKISELLSQKQHFIHIDCSGIPYMSSAGLGVFISYLDEIGASGGKLVLSGLQENVLEVFGLLGLNQLVTIVGDGASVASEFQGV